MNFNNVEFTWLDGYPKNWSLCRVKNYFISTKDKVDDPKDFPILSLTMRGIIERDISKNEGQLPETFSGYVLLQKDDIVFNPMDLISGWVDKSDFVGLISPSYRVLRPLSKNVSIDYYKYFFQRLYNEKILFPFGEGVHYQYRWGLGSETLMNFPILYPPIQEQQQIVEFLDIKTSLIDSLIEKTQKKIELLKEKRTSLINHTVTKGLNPNVEMKESGVEWIGDIPSHWVKSKLKYKSKIYGRIGYRGYTTDDIVEEGEGVITLSPSNIVDGKLNIEKRTYLSYNKYYESPEIIIGVNDIVYVQRGSSIGKSTIIPLNHPEMTINPQLIIIKEYNCLPKYLYFFLKSIVIKIQTTNETNGGSTPLITQNSVENFILTIPENIKEQQQIVEYLDEQTDIIDTTISKEQKRIKLLKEYRQSLISEVVTGKIKVTNE